MRRFTVRKRGREKMDRRKERWIDLDVKELGMKKLDARKEHGKSVELSFRMETAFHV